MDVDMAAVTSEHPEPEAPRRRLRTQRVSQIPLKRRKWLWNQRIPLGELTLWVGHAGIGKSQAAVWLAGEATRGALPGELSNTPTDVLYVGTEDSWSYTLAPRFVTVQADLHRVHRLYAVSMTGDETIMSLSLDLDALRQEVIASGARVVVLDALLSTMSGHDLLAQGVVRELLEPVSRLAQELEIAIIGVAHFRKSGGADPLLLISGSAEFGQVVRSAIGFAADRDAEDGTCVMSLIKTNIAPMETASLRYQIESAVVSTPDGPTDVGRFAPVGETDAHIRDLIDRQPDTAEERGERDEAIEWLKGYLASQGGSAPFPDVLKAARADGIAERTLRRARSRCEVTTSRRVGFGQGSVWSLEDHIGVEPTPHSGHFGHSGQAERSGPQWPQRAGSGHSGPDVKVDRNGRNGENPGRNGTQPAFVARPGGRNGECCEGGPIGLSCQLCARSPSYYQNGNSDTDGSD